MAGAVRGVDKAQYSRPRESYAKARGRTSLVRRLKWQKQRGIEEELLAEKWVEREAESCRSR